jgi:hypothetical protein
MYNLFTCAFVRKFTAFAIVIALLILASIPCFAADDRYLEVYKDKLMTISIDTYNTTVNPNDDTINTWLKKVYTEAGKRDMVRQLKKYKLYNESYDNISHSMDHQIFRIKQASYKATLTVHYNTDSEVIETFEYPNPQFQMIVPDSVWETVYKNTRKYAVSKFVKESKKSDNI